MNPIGSIGSLLSAAPLQRSEALGGPISAEAAPLPGGRGGADFGQVLGNLIGGVDTKMAAAQDLSTKVMLGDGTRLHQSVIAMQEATLSLDLMVQVRNKAVEAYQELMRMQV